MPTDKIKLHKSKKQVPIYPAQIWLLAGPHPVPDLMKESKWFGEIEPDARCWALTAASASRVALVFNTLGLNHNVIAHEVMHAVFAVADDIGLKHNEDAEEAFTYLNGWITTHIYNEFHKANIKVKLK